MKTSAKLRELQVAIWMEKLDKVQAILTEADKKYPDTKYRVKVYELINNGGRYEVQS